MNGNHDRAVRTASSTRRAGSRTGGGHATPSERTSGGRSLIVLSLSTRPASMSSLAPWNSGTVACSSGDFFPTSFTGNT